MKSRNGKQYRLGGRSWQKRKRQVLSREPLCRMCWAGQCTHDKAGRVPAPDGQLHCVREARVLDHIKPLHKGGADTLSNLQPLCVECHDLKTAREAHGRSSGDKPPPHQTGADGWPVE
jgi:5-methylcytosine-specific restriction protein A